MNREKFNYEIEVRMQPNLHDSPNAPYSWVIWETSKETGVKANAGFGWASNPENAWRQAYAYYNRACGESLTKINGIKDVYQPVYHLSDNATYFGDVYENKAEAQHHAAVVDMVTHEGEMKEVCGFSVQKRRYIPCNK